MENRRLFTFLLLSVATVWLWGTLVAPRLFPPPVKKAADPAVVANEEAKGGDKDAEVVTDQQNASAVETLDAPDEGGLVKPSVGKPAEHPNLDVELGSLDPESGYALYVKLTSSGAAVEQVWLTSPQFRDLKNEQEQSMVVGNNLTRDRSLSTSLSLIDEQLKTLNQPPLEAINWKLESQTSNAEGMSAVLSYDSPDGTIRVQKTFYLPRMDLPSDQLADAFRTDPSGYTLQLDLEIINLSDKPQEVAYELQGPVGVLLENEAHTSKYRDIKIEFLSGDEPVLKTAKEIAGNVEDYEDEAGHSLNQAEQFAKLRENEKWTAPFRYAGIDVQFFAALVAPLDERTVEQRASQKWLDRTYPTLVEKNRLDTRKSDISFRMVSTPVLLTSDGADSKVVHRFAFFVGPKRSELLDPMPLAASRVLDYGTYFGFIARGMHWVLDLFYSIGMPYVLAIICLTVLVRGLMYPISRKQAISAAKMKELQPKLAELKEKFGDDREKMARAQMELWRKHKINPVGGCLPLVFQLPVFIGLYTSLNTAVDLRLAKFLWIENLAGPDSLFQMPFTLPFLGSDFNLLPCLTVVLFLMQQKMFMPPAVDEQQEAQQKMMNMMTVFMGAMFWHQPAGLCVYFIASSLWGIAERKLLGTGATSTTSAIIDDGADDVLAGNAGTGKPSVTVMPAGTKDAARKGSASEPKTPGFMQKLMDMAQEARENAEKTRPEDSRNKKKKRDK